MILSILSLNKKEAKCNLINILITLQKCEYTDVKNCHYSNYEKKKKKKVAETL